MQQQDIKSSAGELQAIIKNQRAEWEDRTGGCQTIGTCCLKNSSNDWAALPAIWNQIRVVDIPKSDGETRLRSVAAAAWRAGMTVLVSKLAIWIGDSNPEEIIGGLSHRQAAEIHSRLTEAMERARMSDKCVNGAKLDLKKRFDSVAPLQAIRCGTLTSS